MRLVLGAHRSFLYFIAVSFVIGCLTYTFSISAWGKQRAGAQLPSKTTTKSTNNYEPEARLIEIYQLIGAGKSKDALAFAARLTTDFPNFQLGQLVYGDLLSLQAKPIQQLGELPTHLSKSTANLTALAELREESSQRLKALRERPPVGTIPSQLLTLSSRNKHIIAVDTSKSRLYLLENSQQGVRLIADHYISVGKAGTGKLVEGDLKTPLGVYYLTSPVDPKTLGSLYGGGALPINYPNPFDVRLGKTGSGIWLHGTMPEKYARQPKSTDGCVVLSNPDLHRLMATVAVKTTPVVIATQLIWVYPSQLAPERQQFEISLSQWREAKQSGQTEKLYGFYMSDFFNYGRSLKDWWPSVLADVKAANHRPIQWRDTTELMWRPDPNSKNPNIMVVTYDELLPQAKNAIIKRQYWMQLGNQWKIFFEGTIASS
jgi:L,D-transpeptidase YnhG